MTEQVHRSADHIERDLAETRLNISQTLDAIQERLSPSNVLMSVYRSSGFAAGRDRLGHASQRAVSNAGRAGAALGEGIRHNPMAATLVGVGLAWMLLGHSPDRANGGTWRDAGQGDRGFDASRIKDKAGRAGEGMRRLADTVSNTVSDTVSGVAETAASIARSAQDGARKVTSRFRATSRKAASAAGSARSQMSGAAGSAGSKISNTSEVFMEYASTARDRLGRTGRSAMHYAEEHPFVTAGAFLAVGAMMAAMLPRTRKERELMGDAAAGLAHEAEDMAKDVYDEAKTAVKRVARRASEAAEKEGLTPGHLKEDARTAAERVRNVASAVTQSTREEVDHAISKAGGGAASRPKEGGADHTPGRPGEAGRETRR